MNSSIVALICLIAIFAQASAFVGAPLKAPKAASAKTVSMLFGGGAKKEGGDGMGDMMEQMKKAQEIGQKTKQLQDELDSASIEGSSTDGSVKVYFNGSQKPLKADISDSVIAQGKDAVDKAVSEAMIDAHTKSMEAMTQKITQLYQEMGLPANLLGGMMKP